MSDTTIEQKKCTHYWVIESPDGRTSYGKCKNCGLINEFSNDWHDALVQKEQSAKQEESLIDL